MVEDPEVVVEALVQIKKHIKLILATGVIPDPAREPLTWDQVKDAKIFKAMVEGLGSIIWVVSGACAVAMFAWAAFLLLTANGDEKKIAQGRAVITWVFIGTALIVLSTGLVLLFQEMVTKGIQR